MRPDPTERAEAAEAAVPPWPMPTSTQVGEEWARRALASSLRYQASALRSVAETQLAQAHLMEECATQHERGVYAFLKGVPVMSLSLAPDPVEEAAVGVVELIGEGLVISEPMRAWLDMFDDRLAGGPEFVAAVNEASHAGMDLSERTAGLVAERVRELRAKRAGEANG